MFFSNVSHEFRTLSPSWSDPSRLCSNVLVLPRLSVRRNCSWSTVTLMRLLKLLVNTLLDFLFAN